LITSAGQPTLDPLQVSAGSHPPAEERQTVEEDARASAGQLALVPVQVSATSHSPAETRHTVLEDTNPLLGQAALVPVQLSAMSHAPADARQMAPALPTGCWQVTVEPSHVSVVQALPSSVHAVPFVFTASVGQLAALPVQNSATSHSPAAARHCEVEPTKVSAGQVVLFPGQNSTMSHGPT